MQYLYDARVRVRTDAEEGVCDGVLINNLRLNQLQLYIVFSLLFSPNIPTLGKVTPSISMENVSTQSPNVLLCVERVPSYPCTSLMTPACNSLWVSLQINEKPMFNAVACPRVHGVFFTPFQSD